MDISAFLQEHFPLEDEELLQQLNSMATVRSLKKGDQPVQLGTTLSDLPFLVEGCVRCYIKDSSSEEFTHCFLNHPGDPLFSPPLRAPQICSVEAVFPTTLLSFPLEPTATLMDTNPELLRLQNHILTQALLSHWQSKLMYRQYTAAQRYQWFLTTYPGLDGQVSSQYIASLLGITPVTLSRLRRQRREHPELFQDPLPPLFSI